MIEEHRQLDGAIKQFRRKVQRAGILKGLRKKRAYVKPSTARRLKSVAAQLRAPEGARENSARKLEEWVVAPSRAASSGRIGSI